MKKTLLSLVFASAAAGSVMAQGQVTFVAGGSHSITLTSDDVTFTKVPVGSPAQISNIGIMNIAAYSAPDGTVLTLFPNGLPDLSAWQLASPIIHSINALPGNVAGINLTMANSVAGNNVELEIVGWSGPATTFNQAISSGALAIGWSGSFLSGGALGWSQPTGTAISPAIIVIGPGGFNGLVLARDSPEPSTIALGGLGAVVLFLFRRRK